MERPRPSTIAWGALLGGVALYDITCPPGETLSERVDGALETKRGKVLTLGLIGVTALHLANLLPEKVDPLHQATLLKTKVERELYE